jgi:dihydrofolate synthase/folylpolyglutamate synthase
MGTMFPFPAGDVAGARALAEALSRLERLVDWEKRDRAPTQGSGMRQSVEPARDLCSRLGDPQRRYSSVHVAGTKGKGSVCALIEAALAGAGVAVGRYSSPHVERVNERVTLAGVPLSDGPLAAALGRALDAREAAILEGTAARDASWFDVLTAAAFLALADAEVDMSVVEVGLGGRLDSTNVIDAAVCVVTSIEREHTSILGATRAAIAAEKAAIAGPGCDLVSGLPEDDEAGAVIAAIARRVGARFVHVDVEAGGAGLLERNRRLAAAALDALFERGLAPGGAALLDEAARARAALPGRLERFLLGGTPVVLDGAHVPESIFPLLAELAGDPALAGRCVALLGLGQDKDAAGILKALATRVDTCVGTSAGTGPYLSPEQVARAAREAGLVTEAVQLPDDALERALELARPDGWVLVVGSLHLCGAVRPRLTAGGDDAPQTPPC